MVIIDSEDSKSPRGPRPTPQVLAPPPYAPLSPHGSSPLPPPRSPGARAPPSPFSAPASNYLTIKRERADITGSWNINTTLPAPQFGRSFSLGSDRDSEDAASEAYTDLSGSSATSASIQSTPNLKLFSPRGKIDAAIRVSGSSRAWIEAVSRDEDVALTFPPNSSGAARPPIRLLARSTAGHVQVNLPHPFMGTLRVPSDTVLPPSIRSQSVVLAPSEPPIDRPPILDEPTKPRFGSLPSRSVTPTPPSPPLRASTSEGQSQSGTPSPPLILENVPTTETPMIEVSPTTNGVEPEPVATVTAPEGTTAEPAVRLPEPAPAPEASKEEVGRTSPPVAPPTPLSPPLSPPLETPPGPNASTSSLAPNLPPRSPSRASHHRSPSASSHKPPSISHNRTGSLPGPAPQYDSSECSTVYFIGDYLRSNYAPESWAGDEFVIDSECGRVRVCWYGETADVPWTEDVTSKVKDAIDWKNWKSPKGLKEVTVALPKMSVSRLGRRFGFK